MKKRGFTLIELLAVIVVLAIIALIATPIVMNTIKRSKKGAAERSADSYVKQVEVAVATERLNGNILEGEYQITSDGNLCRDKSASCSDDEKIKIEMNGTKPSSGKIKITNGSVDQSLSSMTIGNYDVTYNSTNKTYEATEKNNSTRTYTIKVNLTNVTGDSGNVTSITSKDIKSLKFTANSGYELPDSVTVSGATSVWDKTTGTLTLSKVTGEVNVTVEGVKTTAIASLCELSEGTKETVGAKYTCHLDSDRTFYVLETSGDNVSLIMDRNFTDDIVPKTLAWCIDGGSDNTTCKNITSKEEGTPLKHIQDTFGSSVEVSVPSANQIATASGKKFSKKNGASDLLIWLYNYLYGTNNPVSDVSGYWTSTPMDIASGGAWEVHCSGSLNFDGVLFGNGIGVRPVITVSKTQLN